MARPTDNLQRALDRMTEQAPEPEDCEHTDHPVCPYCGYAMLDWWELGMEGDGDATEVYCDHCEREFHVAMFISYSFTTRKKER